MLRPGRHRTFPELRREGERLVGLCTISYTTVAHSLVSSPLYAKKRVRRGLIE